MENQGRLICSTCGKPLEIKFCGGEYLDLLTLGSIEELCVCIRCGTRLKGSQYDGQECLIFVCASCGQPIHKIICRNEPTGQPPDLPAPI
ncbi:MAG: hypothetical protein WCT16_01540 [Candidatus Buchananbacteria bacterium]